MKRNNRYWKKEEPKGKGTLEKNKEESWRRKESITKNGGKKA